MSQNAISDYRNNFIPIGNIYGVNVEKGTFVPHEDFKNVKLTERREIINNIKADAKGPLDVDPIELFIDGGKIHVIDGFHRLTALVELAKECGTDAFDRIRFFKFVGTKEDALFEAIRKNLSDSRSPLNEREEYIAIKGLLSKGYKTQEIITRLGKTADAARWVNKVSDIMNATPEVEQAILNDEMSVMTAVAIARKGDLAEQPEMVQEAIAAKQEGLSELDIRKVAGVATERKKMITYPELLERIFSIYEPTWAIQEEKKEIDENLEGQLTAYIEVLGLGMVNRTEAYRKLDELYYTWSLDQKAKEKREAAKASK